MAVSENITIKPRVGVTNGATEAGGTLTTATTMYKAVAMGFYVTKAVAEVRAVSSWQMG